MKPDISCTIINIFAGRLHSEMFFLREIHRGKLYQNIQIVGEWFIDMAGLIVPEIIQN